MSEGIRLITIEGKLVGNIFADKVELLKFAIVHGNITCKSIKMESTSIFVGHLFVSIDAKCPAHDAKSDPSIERLVKPEIDVNTVLIVDGGHHENLIAEAETTGETIKLDSSSTEDRIEYPNADQLSDTNNIHEGSEDEADINNILEGSEDEADTNNIHESRNDEGKVLNLHESEGSVVSIDPIIESEQQLEPVVDSNSNSNDIGDEEYNKLDDEDTQLDYPADSEGSNHPNDVDSQDLEGVGQGNENDSEEIIPSHSTDDKSELLIENDNQDNEDISISPTDDNYDGSESNGDSTHEINEQNAAGPDDDDIDVDASYQIDNEKNQRLINENERDVLIPTNLNDVDYETGLEMVNNLVEQSQSDNANTHLETDHRDHDELSENDNDDESNKERTLEHNFDEFVAVNDDGLVN